MLTRREWEDLLYTLGLFGQDWLYVNRVAEAYVTWKTTGQPAKRDGTEGWGPITEEKLQELLSDPRANLSEADRRLIVGVLHHALSPEEVPLPRLPKIN